MSDSNTGYVSPYPESVKHRFEMKFKKGNPNECWEWLASRNNHGYGKMAVDNTGKLEYSHRLSYKLYKGDIPDGMVVMHSCDNKGCVNPNHLGLGTTKQNIRSAATNGLMNNRPRLFGEKNASSKLTDSQVYDIFKLRHKGLSQDAIAKQLNVSQSQVSRILRKVSRANNAQPIRQQHTFATRSQGVGDARKTITNDIRQRITELSKQGLSQREVAIELGISQCSVSKALAKSNPSGN